MTGASEKGSLSIPGSLTGLDIIADPNMTERRQVRYPRTKKQRIRRKWAGRQENYRSFPSRESLQIGRRIYMHPARFEELRNEIAKRYQP